MGEESQSIRNCDDQQPQKEEPDHREDVSSVQTVAVVIDSKDGPVDTVITVPTENAVTTEHVVITENAKAIDIRSGVNGDCGPSPGDNCDTVTMKAKVIMDGDGKKEDITTQFGIDLL